MRVIMPRAGVDIDDVLYPTMMTLVRWHNREYGTKHSYFDYKSYLLMNLWKVSRNEVMIRMDRFVESDDFANMQADKWAAMSLRDLVNWWIMFCITSRREVAQRQTYLAMNADFSEIFNEIYFTDHCADKNNGGYRRTKLDLCRELKLDVMIEDCLEYALECARVVKRVYLLDKPWNKKRRLPKKIVRIKNGWKELHVKMKEYGEQLMQK